jgi:hypothetical protein
MTKVLLGLLAGLALAGGYGVANHKDAPQAERSPHAAAGSGG